MGVPRQAPGHDEGPGGGAGTRGVVGRGSQTRPFLPANRGENLVISVGTGNAGGYKLKRRNLLLFIGCFVIYKAGSSIQYKGFSGSVFLSLSF